MVSWGYPTVKIRLVSAALAVVWMVGAVGQTPPAAGGPPLPSPSYGSPIGLSQAKLAATAVEHLAGTLGFDGVTIAIVQPDGNLVLFEKMDDSTYASIQFALAKARTAAISQRATGPSRMGGPPLPDMIALPGGLPIVVNGRNDRSDRDKRHRYGPGPARGYARHGARRK